MTDDSEFRKKAVAGAGWVAADKWSNRIVGLVILAVLGRLLSPTDFGLVAIVTAVMTLVGVFSEQGFGKALVQRAELPAVYPATTFWVSVGSAVVLAAGTVVSAPYLADIFGDTELIPLIQVMSVGLLITALSSTPAALLERDFQFRALAIRRFSGTIAGGIAAVGAALLGMGVWSLVIQTLVTAVVGLITLWAACEWRPQFKFSFRALRDMWSIGASIMGMGLVGIANSQADRLLIGAVLTPEAVGYYFLAIRVVGIMVDLFSSIFSGVSLTTFSRLQDDRPKLLRWFYKLTNMSSTTALPVFALAMVTAPVLLPFAFGEQWVPSVPIFQILCLLGALNAVAYFDRTVLIAVGRARAAFLLLLGQTILGIVLVVAALPWGVIAVALAVTLRQYVYWPIRLITLKKYISVAPGRYFVQWLRPFLISLVAATGCVFLSFILPGLSVDYPVAFVGANTAVVGGIYCLGIWLFERQYFSDVWKILRRRL